MEHSLLCPNQCREKGIETDTGPKAYCNEESAQNLIISESQHINPIIALWTNAAFSRHISA